MRSNAGIKLTVLIITLACLLAAAGAQTDSADKIIAAVNNEVITLTDLRRAISPVIAQYSATYSQEEMLDKVRQLQRDGLKQLIENRLIIQASQTDKFVVEDLDIQEGLKNIRSRFSSEDEFLKGLSEQGMTLADLRKSIMEQYILKYYPKEKIFKKIIVSPAEIEDYYKNNLSKFEEKEMFRLKHIMIKKDEGAEEKSRILIKEIDERLSKGEDFSSLAKKYSQGPNAAEGGDMGFIPKGNLIPQLEKAAEALGIGERSAIIETPIGYHIIFLAAKKERRLKPLSEASKEIEETLQKEKSKQSYDDWIRKLRGKAYIKIYE